MFTKNPPHYVCYAAVLLLAVTGCTKQDLDAVVPVKAKDNVAGPKTDTVAKPKSVVVAKDTDGNVYHLDTIGTQVWMVENLKVTHYRNGDPIPYTSDALAGGYCNYNNDETIATVYGRLYNYYSIQDPRNVCPKGFHLPTNEEWQTLENTLGGNTLAGGKMKEAGIVHWIAPNTAATNSSGFTALPGGNAAGLQFFDMGKYAYFWADPSSIYSRALIFNIESDSGISNTTANQSFSIRCIKDNSEGLPL